MMTCEHIQAYCLSKRCAAETYPFGPTPICYKLNGKIFAQLYPYPEDYKITLKCTREMGELFRFLYPHHVTRGYHCPPVQQPYWNTIALEGFPEDELIRLIDHAYDAVLHSFSRKVQKTLCAPSEKEEPAT